MKTKIDKIILYVAFALIALTVLDLILVDKKIYYMCQAECIIDNILIVLIIMIMLGFLLKMKINHKVIGIKGVKIKYVFIICNIILLLYQLYFSWNIYFHTGWDCRQIINTASSIAYNIGENNTFYYSMFPNNVMLTYIFSLILEFAKITNISKPYFLLVVVSNILINISGVVLVATVNKVLHNTKLTAYSYIMYVLLIGISPWITIPYSDTYSLIFPILAMYIYVNIQDDKNDIWKWLLLFMVVFMGYKIKPTIIIILIAITIIGLINFSFNKLNNLIVIKRMIALIAAYLLITILANHGEAYLEKNMGDFDKDRAFTYMHFLMMGLNNERTGVYSLEDVEFSNSYDNIEDREEAELEIIKSRLKAFGIVGYSEFLMKKLLVIYNDGTFAWGAEGEFYKEVLNLKDNHISEFLRSIYYNDGKYYFVFRLFKQMQWLTVLILMLGIIFQRNRDNKGFIILQISILSIIGVTAFLLLFEARARYLFCYSPIFILCSTFGLRNIYHLIDSKRKH